MASEKSREKSEIPFDIDLEFDMESLPPMSPEEEAEMRRFSEYTQTDREFIACNVRWIRDHFELSRWKLSSILGISKSLLKEIENASPDIPKSTVSYVCFLLRLFCRVYPSEMLTKRLEDVYKDYHPENYP